ncbi:hypothetical protein LSH36_719g00006 [Paralvinella palmiformis]|uniref:Gamma-tubulin complex component n=1 Tax=Paralvinella palmiformis TaxID=53620 RepID=A0AAD9MT77_9ANNE|nr:hypothetical protein LSH36_719g00006 [Paralvinella palmiformis]
MKTMIQTLRDFKLIFQLIRSSKDAPGAEVYTDMLQKNMTPYITTQVSAHNAKRKIAESSPTPGEFLQKYEELKSKNVRDLDPLVHLLSKICEDAQVKNYLKTNAEERAAASGVTLTAPSAVLSLLPTPGTQMSHDELAKIKAQLMKVTSNTGAITPAGSLRKVINERLSAKNMNLPAQPDWIFSRPYLTMDFVHDAEPPDPDVVPVGSMPISAQEMVILEDLLYCMEGIEGRYIQALPLTDRYAQRDFRVDQTLDPSLREAVKRVLPLCSNYSTVIRFIEEKQAFEYGLVNHALSASMRNLIQGQLSLQKLWFYVQPTMSTMEILASVASAVNRACVPYFEILEKWMFKGIIVDPYCEYIRSYWEQHYTICRERVPIFLERVADKILNAGKYLNVVRQCGRDVHCPLAEEIVYTLTERKYFEHIENAYNYASKLLLDLLMEEKELLARLKSIKHYFLLDQGDFIVQFLDMAEEEMKKPMEEIIPTRLETLLELALRTSTANVDPYKDDLRVDLLSYDLVTQLFKILTIETKLEKEYRVDPADLHLSGLEAFSFDYMVKWPVSLVINRRALTRYQMLFRHLFYCKHVERQLCNVWISNKSAKMFTLYSTRWYASAFALRQRMLNFVQNFEYYMMFEVIEPSWHVFQTNMETVSNIDDVVAYHSDFLNNCLTDCMLTNPQLLKIVHKLMLICVTFSNFIQRLNETTNVDLEVKKLTRVASLGVAQTSKDHKDESMKKKATSKVVLEHVDQMASSENFERTINNFDSNFSHHLVDLLTKIMDFRGDHSEHKLMNIMYRLDFNNFYTAKLESASAENSGDAGLRDVSKHSSKLLSVAHMSVLGHVCTKTDWFADVEPTLNRLIGLFADVEPTLDRLIRLPTLDRFVDVGLLEKICRTNG